MKQDLFGVVYVNFYRLRHVIVPDFSASLPLSSALDTFISLFFFTSVTRLFLF